MSTNEPTAGVSLDDVAAYIADTFDVHTAVVALVTPTGQTSREVDTVTWLDGPTHHTVAAAVVTAFSATDRTLADTGIAVFSRDADDRSYLLRKLRPQTAILLAVDAYRHHLHTGTPDSLRAQERDEILKYLLEFTHRTTLPGEGLTAPTVADNVAARLFASYDDLLQAIATAVDGRTALAAALLKVRDRTDLLELADELASALTPAQAEIAAQLITEGTDADEAVKAGRLLA